MTDSSSHTMDSSSSSSRTQPVFYQCPDCPASFSNATGAWSHFFMWHDEDIQIHRVREWRVGDEDENDGDMDLKDDDDDTGIMSEILCEICGVIYSSLSLSSSPSPHHCYDDPGGNKSEPSVTCSSLLSITNNNKSVKKKCQSCSQMVTMRMYSYHARVHVGGRIPCLVEGCGGLFRTRNNRKDHMVQAHPGLKPSLFSGQLRIYDGGGINGSFSYVKVDCPGCCEKVPINVLPHHRRSNHPTSGKEGPVSKCPGCFGLFNSSKQLAKHQRHWHQAGRSEVSSTI